MFKRFSKAVRTLANPPKTVAVLRLSGPIGAAGRFARGLDDASLAPLIDRAFKSSRLAAVALAINSPGGAPTQSALIASRIREAAREKETPVFAFCEDVAASGGYWLACAADEIFVEDNSIVGSIGVVSASFGFHDAITRLGVDRRVTTAGVNKMRLDPFQPEKPDDVAWLQRLQTTIHQNFIRMVTETRGAKIGADPAPELFSGDVWVGADAVSVGLADGVGRLKPVMKERFGDDVRFSVVAPRKGFMALLSGGAEAAAPPLGDGAAFAARLVDEIESRALWSRYGL